MGLSLKELKEELIAKEGYTITPNHNQLADLKALVDDMMNVRSESPPSSGSGYYSGTTCSGHVHHSGYKLSLGDINALDIKSCSCNSVKDTTAYCRSRTYYCSCNSNVPTCDCNVRTGGSCSCKSRTSQPTCDSHFTGCDCQNRGLYGDSCTCDVLEECYCRSRTSQNTCDCNTRTGYTCYCQSRTSSCGSRDTTSCTCNGRCACNSEKRFE